MRGLGKVQFGWVSQVRWSPSGDMLAIAGGDGIAIYTQGFGGAPTFRLTAHSAPVKDIAFNSDGSRLASGSADTTLKLRRRFRSRVTFKPLFDNIRCMLKNRSEVLCIKDCVKEIGSRTSRFRYAGPCGFNRALVRLVPRLRIHR